MKIKHQLSIATLVMVGIFATGCSQQSTGGSQVSGGSQQQVEGGSQVAGGSQQQQEEVKVIPPVTNKPPRARVVRKAPKPAPVRKVRRTRRVASNPWLHYHPEAPKCAKTRKHSHKFKRTGARHHHRYACVKPRPRARTRTIHRANNTRRVRVAPTPPTVNVRALQSKLKAKGFYRGPIDGIVGPGTRSALKRFMNR